MRNTKGFTLIELLIVIVIISILAAVIFVAVDPAQRFGDARNARRRSEVVSILNALLKYQVDNDGSLPAALDATATSSQVLGTAGTGCNSGCAAAGTTEAACADLGSALVDTYLASIPQDPNTGTATNTGYYVNVSANGRLVVGACAPENSATISVSR